MSWAAFGMGALGRLVGNLSDTYGTGDTKKEKERKDAESDYLARERQGIIARTEGAKAAGLHPLAVLGAQNSNAPTTYVSGSDPIIPQGDFRDPPKSDPNIDRYNAARARLAEAEADKAEMDLARSRHALAGQPGNPPQSPMPTSASNLTSSGRLRNGVVVEPDKVTAGVGGRTAGVHQGSTDYEMPGGWSITLPSNEASQAMEDMDWLKYVVTAIANKDRVARSVLEWLAPLKDVHPVLRSREAEKEVQRIRARHPPKGDYYISPRSRGGVVR